MESAFDQPFQVLADLLQAVDRAPGLQVVEPRLGHRLVTDDVHVFDVKSGEEPPSLFFDLAVVGAKDKPAHFRSLRLQV